jgi:outer membrane lipoprotein-sorting protein
MWRGATVILAYACLQFGCAGLRSVPRPPEKSVPPLTNAQDAIRLLRDRYGNIDSLKASGKIETVFPAEHYRRRASFALMLERPDKLRIRTYRTLLVPMLFELVYNGGQCWLFVPGSKTAYLSEECSMFYVNDRDIALPADIVVDSIIVVSDFEALHSLPVRLRWEDDFAILIFLSKSGTEREIWIDSKTGIVDRQLFLDINEGPELIIEYGKMQSANNAIVPADIEIFLPKANASVSLFVDDFKLNTNIPFEAFEFSPPAGTTILRSEEDIQELSEISGGQHTRHPVLP